MLRFFAKIVILASLGLGPAVALLSSQVCYADPDQGSAKDPATVPDTASSQKSLTIQEQDKFLGTRLPGNVIGNLGSFASLLYAMEGTLIGSSSKEVLHRPLRTVYPEK